MSSDADYAAFLKKSQKDYSQGAEIPAATTSNTAPDTKVHPEIKALGERYYVSDADEPFENVSLSWDQKTLPSEEEFGELIGGHHDREITWLEPSKWDIHGEYKDVVDAVSKAATSGGGVVKVYRAGGSGSRVEYFVVGVDTSERKVVGVKVLAIES